MNDDRPASRPSNAALSPAGPPERGRRRRWLVATVVVGGWLVMMLALVARQSHDRSTDTVPLGGDSLVTDQRFGLFAGTERVGDVRLDQRAESRDGRPGVVTEITTRLEMQLMERPTDLELDGTIWRAIDRSRGEMAFTLASNGSSFHLGGVVEDGMLEATIDSGATARDGLGSGLPLRVPVGEELWVESGLGRSLRLPPLAPGEEVEMASFDPMTLSPGTTRIRGIGVGAWRVDGAMVEAHELRLESTSGETATGIESIAWVDAEGGLLEATTPIGLVLRRDGSTPLDPVTDRAAAGSTGTDSPSDLLSLTALRPEGLRPRRGVERLRFRLALEGDRAAPVLLEDAFQRVVTESPGSAESGPVSIVTARATAPDREPRPSDLAPEPLIESTHPLIVAQAREIVAGLSVPETKIEPTAEERARAIHDWVFETLEKEPVLSVPSALEVLTTRRGDCNEHATLYTALARAADVPTRIAVGLVWSEALEGFYYHAWPEVWLGDTWARADPTLGQWPADATHLKLVEGGIEAWPRLIPFLGRLQITVLEPEAEESWKS